MYDCQNCPVAEAREALAPENAEAWALFWRVCRRLTLDLALGGALIAKALEELNAEDSFDLVERLSTIYDICVPPTKQS